HCTTIWIQTADIAQNPFYYPPPPLTPTLLEIDVVRLPRPISPVIRRPSRLFTMSTVLRSVGRVVQLHQQRMSAGFSAFRLNGAQLNVDPLLNIDWFDMSQPTFRPHPHAGFSAVTYLLPGSPGSFMNRDSRGNKEPIHPGLGFPYVSVLGELDMVVGACMMLRGAAPCSCTGDVHWTTAGGGVVHEEVPVQGQGQGQGQGPYCCVALGLRLQAGVSCQGLQIFVNLPPQLKSVEPRADHLSSDAIPLYSSPDNAKVRVIAGSVGGVTSPLQLVYPVTLLHVQLPQGSSLQHKVPPGHSVLLLVLEGEVRVAQGLPAAPSSWTHLPFASAADMQGEGEVQLHGPAEGSEASSGQVLLFSGQPIGAPVVWRGPFCGNSTAEVERWARAYQAGSMGSLEASF
ncbi:hypothetical protein QJQ45_024768, partial [Haematococcus lacustris]